MRPARIDQLLPSIVGRDAVGHHTLEAQGVLRSLGFVSEIYAEGIGREMWGRAHPISELPRLPPGRQWLIYQASTGSRVAEVFAEHPGRKLLDYHNITPGERLDGWLPSLAEELRLGRRQMAELSGAVCYAFCDSAYNCSELRSWGYRHSAVSMLMLDRANLARRADRRLSAALGRQRQAGETAWLFVGQLLPHKAQHDVVAAFAAYRKAYDERARLRLVGRRRVPLYAESVVRLADELGVGDSVELLDSVTAAELVALYEGSDVYVCCSEHEGFCAPLIEAMHHRLPVVAYGAGAVPETLGGAGVLLGSKEPALVAAAVRRLMKDEALSLRLQRVGLERSEDFSPRRARRAFAGALEQALGAA